MGKIRLCSGLSGKEKKEKLSLEVPPSSWWPSSEAWVESVASTIEAGPVAGLEEVFAGLGVPALDLLVTPMSARVGLWSAGEGRGFFHHELRGAIAMPEGLEPERAVWEGETVPVWGSGVRMEPKYFSFFQEAPLAPYNPNYRRKWRAHELLHGLLRFFWHPQMNRFSLYLSARVNELLPVVHWYGWDEAFRPRCAEHRHGGPLRSFCVACEAEGRAYWQREAAYDRAGAREDALRHAEAAREHFFSEWSVCLKELESGRRIVSPRGYLDASSDAMGYVYGHWPRLTAWSFGSWAELFLLEGVDVFSTVAGLMEHHLGVASGLLMGDIEVDAGQCQRMLQRRLLQDLGYRTLLALEWMEEGSMQAKRAERILWPVLESMGARCRALLDTDADLASGYGVFSAWEEAVRAAVPARLAGMGERAISLGATGVMWPQMQEITGKTREAWLGGGAAILREGIQSAASWFFLDGSLTQRGAVLSEESLAEFAHSSAFVEHGRLMVRWSAWLASRSDLSAPWREMARFLAWSQEEPRKDEEAEDFGALPDDVEDLLEAEGVLRWHQTLRYAPWPGWLAEEVLDERPEAESQEEMDALLWERFRAASAQENAGFAPRTLAVIHHAEAMKLLPLDAEMEAVLQAVASGKAIEDWWEDTMASALWILLEESFVVWLPAPM